jgi:hypothetical protein
MQSYWMVARRGGVPQLPRAGRLAPPLPDAFRVLVILVEVPSTHVLGQFPATEEYMLIDFPLIGIGSFFSDITVVRPTTKARYEGCFA